MSKKYYLRCMAIPSCGMDQLLPSPQFIDEYCSAEEAKSDAELLNNHAMEWKHTVLIDGSERWDATGRVIWWIVDWASSDTSEYRLMRNQLNEMFGLPNDEVTD